MAVSLVATAKLNGIEPLVWLADVLERMVSGRTKIHKLGQLLPWTWRPSGSRLRSMPEQRRGRTTLAMDLTRLRLWTGFVLFLFAATHLANHTLGLISLEAM